MYQLRMEIRKEYMFHMYQRQCVSIKGVVSNAKIGSFWNKIGHGIEGLHQFQTTVKYFAALLFARLFNCCCSHLATSTVSILPSRCNKVLTGFVTKSSFKVIFENSL